MMKKLGLGAIALMLLAGCGNANTGVTEEGATDADAPVTTGAVTETAEVNNDGTVTSAEVTKENGKITAISIDETNDEGLSKKELGDTYGMKKASSVEKEWYEQVEALENYILENGVDAVQLDSDGKVTNEDLKSSCTISVNNMVQVVKDAEAKLK